MNRFDYINPVNIKFGCGIRKEIGGILHGKYTRVLLVCAKGPFRENGLFDDISASIISVGIDVFQMPDIDQNPRLSSVRTGVAICSANKIDCVIALGGGSAMDCAKLIAASAATGIDAYRYVFGDRPPVENSLDTVMIPTIAATGTEVNNSSVIVNDENSEKYYCNCFFPKYTIIDPEIVVTVPYRLAVWGAMDILSHTFEYYFNGFYKAEFQTCLSEAILKATMNAVNLLSKNHSDINACGELSYCAVMAWGGLTKIGRADPDMTCHSIEESFSGFFDTHHGACLGVLTPRWMECVVDHAPEIFARFARNVMNISGDDDKIVAHKGISAYKNWLISVAAPNTYADLGNREFADNDLVHVAKTAWRIYNGNIGRLKKFTFDEILKLLFSGKIPYKFEEV